MRFVTLFPKCPNVGLVKDVGQIPYTLGRLYKDIDTELVSCQIDMNGNYIEDVKGLKITRIPYLANDVISGVSYLFRHSRQIDWLNIYHCGRKALIWSKIYKTINKKGKIYLKLDADFFFCKKLESDSKERKRFKKLTEYVDMVSVESRAVYDRIQKYTDRKIIIVPNGYCMPKSAMGNTQEKENIFLTVGRIGTKQKATDILLNAFAKTMGNHNWSLRLVGPVTEKFNNVITDFYKEHPDAKDRVVFTGAIDERESIYQEYQASKVFILPSRWESFGISAIEAMSCGCRLILTNQIPACKEMTNNGEFGTVIDIDNSDSLAEALMKEIDRSKSDMGWRIKEYAKQEFSWMKICEKLYSYL